MSDTNAKRAESPDDVPWYREALVLKGILDIGGAVCLCLIRKNLAYHSLRGDVEWWWLADRDDVELPF